MLTAIKPPRAQQRHFDAFPSARKKMERHNILMDALRVLAEMAEENPQLVSDLPWQKASEGIATILKGKI